MLDAVFGRYVDAGRLRRALVAHRDEVLVGALTVAALVLRLFHLGVESFWFDEADIVAQARRPRLGDPDQLHPGGRERPALYAVAPLLDHGWWARAKRRCACCPMIFGTATIPLMYLAGRRLFTPRAGAAGRLLLTISPFHIWHSQDAKMYTLVVFVTLLSTRST